MEHVVLDHRRDVEQAADLALSGRAVHVVVGFEMGPDGPEPKVELLRLLLDRVQRRFSVERRRYVPHPFVDSRYLRSCVVDPSRPPGRSGGVREPRRPRPDPLGGAASLDESEQG